MTEKKELLDLYEIYYLIDRAILSDAENGDEPNFDLVNFLESAKKILIEYLD